MGRLRFVHTSAGATPLGMPERAERESGYSLSSQELCRSMGNEPLENRLKKVEEREEMELSIGFASMKAAIEAAEAASSRSEAVCGEALRPIISVAWPKAPFVRRVLARCTSFFGHEVAGISISPNTSDKHMFPQSPQNPKALKTRKALKRLKALNPKA